MMAPISSPSATPVIAAAAQANVMLLAQGAELLERLGQDQYIQPVPTCFNSAAGGHFRHVIEHVQAVLASIKTGVVDYEGRARDASIETDAAHARDVIATLQVELQRLMEREGADLSLTVNSETIVGAQLATTLARELEFLISHTVHHFALIAVIAGAHGVVTPVGFGMAPSTLKYQQEQMTSCAR